MDGQDPAGQPPCGGSGGANDQAKETPCNMAAVTYLIVGYMQLYMTKEEVVATLFAAAKIEHGFTAAVWEQLERENPDFFKAYNTSLKLRDQINLWNHLLEQQLHHMAQTHPILPLPHKPKQSFYVVPKQSFDVVKNLVEGYMKLYMTREEIIATLFATAKIKPHFTANVWKKLKEQKPELFNVYYMSMEANKQLKQLNHLLQQQYQLMAEVHPNLLLARNPGQSGGMHQSQPGNLPNSSPTAGHGTPLGMQVNAGDEMVRNENVASTGQVLHPPANMSNVFDSSRLETTQPHLNVEPRSSDQTADSSKLPADQTASVEKSLSGSGS